MKKLFTTLFFALLSTAVFAQSGTTNESEPITNEGNIEIKHLSFKGIPIDGSPEEFGKALSRNGFTYDYEYNNVLFYKGSFAGYNGCYIAIKSSNNIVYEVVVLFPENYSWSHLYNNYTNIKTMLTLKYGEPTIEREEFVNTPIFINLDDDNDKFYEVKDGHCVYGANFTSLTDGLGNITIEIKDTGRVGLYYEDFMNSLSKEMSAFEDL